MKTLAALVLFSSTIAYAHGDATHAKQAAQPVSSEERAFGREGDPRQATRTVRIDMSDKMRFSPDRLTIRQGETVKFVVKNSGKTMHEMVIGTPGELKSHAELMKKHPGMEHEEPYMAHVAPGKTESITWQFTKAGEFQFGCLVPGHFEAGMVGDITVVVAQAADLVDGEVRKVDREAKKVTLRHGPLPKLDMPAMTMVFQVKDPALLEGLKPGDKVRFDAEKQGGAYTVTRIEPAK